MLQFEQTFPPYFFSTFVKSLRVHHMHTWHYLHNILFVCELDGDDDNDDYNDILVGVIQQTI